jgi:hypothetical protein
VTRRELLHRTRLLSNARVASKGKIPDDPAKWWQQIEAVAAELNLPITWEEWHSVSRKRDDDELPL